MLLAVYSAVLLLVEFRTSQDYVRHYFTDIEGPVFLYAINTSVSIAFLWSAALLFGVSRMCRPAIPDHGADRFFFGSQAAVFAYLAIDDRFKLHETIAGRLGIPDHYVLLAVAGVEAGLLAAYGREWVRTCGRPLATAVLLTGLMLVFDALVPERMLWRLSIEDLAKTWAGFCFFLFAARVLRGELAMLRRPQPDALSV